MDEAQLFQKLDKQYREESYDGPYPDFRIDEPIEGSIDLTEIIFKVLKQYHDIDFEDNVDPDGIYRGDPNSIEKIEFGIIIKSDFEHLEFDSSPLYIKIKNDETKTITGKSILFRKGYEIEANENICIFFENLKIDDLKIEYYINKIEIYNLIAENININFIHTINSQKLINEKIIILGLIQNINIGYVNSKFINIVEKKYDNLNNKINFNNSTITTLSIIFLNKSEIVINFGNYENIEFEIPDYMQKVRLYDFFAKTVSIMCNKIENGIIQDMKIVKISGLETLTISGMECHRKYGRFNITNFALNQLELLSSFKGYISDLHLENLIIDDMDNYGELKFRNISFSSNFTIKYFFKKIFNRKKSQFKPKRKGFVINRSILNNTIFINCIFPSILWVHEIDINKIVLINTIFPRKIKSLNNDFSNDKISIYQQIKKNYENRGDRETAAMYRSRELNSRLWKLLFNLKFFINIEEVFNLLINSISNNHGQSWGRTIFAASLYGILAYGCFLSSIDLGLLLTLDGLNNYFDYLLHIFQFIIPGFIYPNKSKFDDLLGFFRFESFASLPRWSQFWIFFNDIVAMPYFIYQFISAFRKHGGK